MIYLVVFISLFAIEISYFRLASYFNIIDKPNERSLHSQLTIRGGGIIFPIAATFFFFFNSLAYPYFFLGLCIISLISFLDDIFTLSNKYRAFVHFLSIFLLQYQLNLHNQIGYLIIFVMIIMVGIINAYNFMDGINGITGGYSLVCLVSMLYVNQYIVNFVETDFIIFVLLGVVVFNLFNFRKKAKCFAGDIGSVSIAFIILFLLLKLIFQTNRFEYILFLALYGIDTIFTIIIRLREKENIFQAHKKHLFQLLVYRMNFSHLQISSIYAIVQMIINIFIIFFLINSEKPIFPVILSLIILSVIYFLIRHRISKIPITVK